MISKKIAAGVDIGGTNCVFGLVDAQGSIIFRGHLPTGANSDPERLVRSIAAELHKAISALPGTELLGVGVGAPNGNYLSGCIEYAPNLNWEGVIPIAAYFKNHLSCEAYLTNDANAAAYGEMLFGGARGMKDFLFITLGTGLGSGIVSNGQMIYGHDGMAGELGHTILIDGGRLCGCGRNGCLETYCSARGLERTYAEKTGKAASETNAKEIYKLARGGDSAASDTFKETGTKLGFALANSVAYTSPEAIFLFGGLAQAAELLFEPTQESLENNLLKIYRNKVKLLPSLLPESDAALLGAASLVWAQQTRLRSQ
jgi:glucokinase